MDWNNTLNDYYNPDPARDLEQLGFAPYLTITTLVKGGNTIEKD
jgi:hypothetical protein